MKYRNSRRLENTIGFTGSVDRGSRIMVAQTRPLAEITHEAIKVLFQTLGIVDTVRFVNQFTTGYGNYTEEREALFGDMPLDEVIAEIKRSRSEPEKDEA